MYSKAGSGTNLSLYRQLQDHMALDGRRQYCAACTTPTTCTPEGALAAAQHRYYVVPCCPVVPAGCLGLTLHQAIPCMLCGADSRPRVWCHAAQSYHHTVAQLCTGTKNKAHTPHSAMKIPVAWGQVGRWSTVVRDAETCIGVWTCISDACASTSALHPAMAGHTVPWHRNWGPEVTRLL